MCDLALDAKNGKYKLDVPCKQIGEISCGMEAKLEELVLRGRTDSHAYIRGFKAWHLLTNQSMVHDPTF